MIVAQHCFRRTTAMAPTTLSVRYYRIQLSYSSGHAKTSFKMFCLLSSSRRRSGTTVVLGLAGIAGAFYRIPTVPRWTPSIIIVVRVFFISDGGFLGHFPLIITKPFLFTQIRAWRGAGLLFEIFRDKFNDRKIKH